MFVKSIEQLTLENEQLKAELQTVTNTANDAVALKASMEVVVNIIERSFFAHDAENITKLLFDYTNREGLHCIVSVQTNEGEIYFSSSHLDVSEKEKGFIHKAKNAGKLVELKDIIIVNFPNISVLLNNMPVSEVEKYERIKQLIPMLLSAFNEKISALNTTNEIYLQSEKLVQAFNSIEGSLDRNGSALSDNAKGTTLVLSAMLQDLSMTLPSLALEDDQEEFILNKIENAVNAASELASASEHISNDFEDILKKLHEVVVEQESLLNSLEPKTA